MRVRNEVTLAPLRTEWGAEYEKNLADTRPVVRELLEGELAAPMGVLEERVWRGYGPKGVAVLLKAAHALAKIKRDG